MGSDAVPTEAFARPPGSTESLQRPPETPEIIVYQTPTDPWRSPASAVQLGVPARSEEPEPDPPPAPPVGTFTLREALFQRHLRPTTLITLAVLALVIGAGGAVLGALVSSKTVTPESAAELTSAAPAVERPAGSVADIAARVLPSVVSIEVRMGEGGEAGSGIVIDAAGHILTNNHVISLATGADTDLSVIFDSGTRAPAHIVGRDQGTDIAVIKVDNVTDLTVATLGDSDALAVGDTVVAIGSPLGLSGTVTTGIVSALHRAVRLGGSGTDTNAVIDAIQTDAAINPGNSGGPLVNATGAVIGINTAIRTLASDPSSAGSIGLGFAMPVNDASRIATALIDQGHITHATLGVSVRSATDGSATGALVQAVDGGGPAAQAGIQEGDVITQIGDRTVRNADELAVAVDRYQVGSVAEVHLLRDGRIMSVAVTFGEVRSG